MASAGESDAGKDADAVQRNHFLSEEQRNRFHEEGYLVLPDWWSKEECGEIRERVQQVVKDMDLDEARTIFSTDENKHAEDDYFLGSGDKIRFFWEDGAFDSNGAFVSDRFKCINKIGHALHDLDPVLKKYSYENRVGQVAESASDTLPGSGE